jgi:predicted nuclease of predicted toxin-antitoxin system
MRFMADESCDFAVVRALREAGHDVLYVSETDPGAEDDAVVARAYAEGRVVLTEDRDFGRLVFAASRPAVGVLYLRFPLPARDALGQAVLNLVREKGDALMGSFVTLQPGRARISRLP